MKSFTIDDVDVTFIDDKIIWLSHARIDSDGSDNRHHDKYWQAETSLSHNRKPIDAESVPYIVVPPAIIQSVKPIVLGCLGLLRNIKTGQTTWAVVADIGPKTKLGELSCEAARRLGLSGNPNTGGTDQKIIKYTIWPGRPAMVNGVQYDLQPSHS